MILTVTHPIPSRKANPVSLMGGQPSGDIRRFQKKSSSGALLGEKRNPERTDGTSFMNGPFPCNYLQISILPKQNARIQSKLKVNQPGDKYEKEADRMAEQVMGMSDIEAGGISLGNEKIQRQYATCEKDEEEEEMIQTKRNSGVTKVPPSFQSHLSSSHGEGSPLPMATNQFMSFAFCRDFSNVRVHDDPNAYQMNRNIRARAFTHGSDIYFNKGRYSPESSAGRRLLAHELTHVVQQDAIHLPMLQRNESPGRKKEEMPIEHVPFQEKAPPPTGKTRPVGNKSAISPKLELAKTARPTCNPKGLSRKDYLAQPHTSTNDFGLTRFAGNIKMELTTRKVRGRFMLEPLKVALPVITSFYTKADTFIEGEVVVLSNDRAKCPGGGKMPLQWQIFSPGANKIREGEVEHCMDLKYAYDVTLGWYSQVVDNLIAKRRRFRSVAAALKHLEKLTGTHPNNWVSVFECLAKKTEVRDGRKFTSAWHMPQVKPRPPRLKDGCKFARALVTGATNFPQLGKHPTPDVIKGCGESPNAVKSLAAITAAKTSASGGTAP